MRSCGGVRSLLVVAPFVLAACADSQGFNTRPTVSVAGLVSNAMSQPVPDTTVSVRSYSPNACGSSSTIEQFDVKTNASGIYRVSLTAFGTYSACIRVSVGATVRDTTVNNLPEFSTVQMNMSLP